MNNDRKKSRLLTAIILVVISCILIAMPVLAGQGNGSGGGQDEPLNLVSSTPTTGDMNFPINGEIKLSFNKNVVNLAVKDSNKACFGLYNPDGSKLPIEVIMPDDQINPEQNQNVTLKPLQELRNGTAYVIKISPQLQAKNGTKLGKEIVVSFVTIATASNSTPTNSEEKEKSAVTTSSDKVPETGKQNSNLAYIVIVGAVLAVGLGYLYFKKSNKK